MCHIPEVFATKWSPGDKTPSATVGRKAEAAEIKSF